MYFSKITLDASQADFNAVSGIPLESTYEGHKLIWEFFADDPDRKRDFLYRFDMTRNTVQYITVSGRQPMTDLPFWCIDSKRYSPQLARGDRLYFSVRANPVVKKRDENNRQHRHDVVMDAKNQAKQENGGNGVKTDAELIQRAGEDWISARSEQNGFTLIPGTLRAEGYRQHRFRKGRGSRTVTISTIDFSGVLEVKETDKFTDLLFNGLGPAKGFGCGLMLIKRVN